MAITQERKIELAYKITNSKPGTCIPVSKEELDWINAVTLNYLRDPNYFNKLNPIKEITDEQPWY